jgi:hypothetical protein
MIYSVNKKGSNSGKKIQNAVAHYKKLQERIAFEGNTLWLQNALTIVLAKLKKYAVNLAKI